MPGDRHLPAHSASSRETATSAGSIGTREALATVRAQFPALFRQYRGGVYSYLDGPGGTQVPRRTIGAIAGYLERSNANHDGAFPTSEESDAILAEAHGAAADFVGARPDEIAFGQNMTSLTFAVSRAIGRTLRAGDEVVVTRLDHDANIAPWLALEEERGVVVRWVGIRAADCTLDLAGLERSLGPRTRVVAVGLASNAVGNDQPDPPHRRDGPFRGGLDVCGRGPCRAAPADRRGRARHGLPRLLPYKFFGPHLGLLYGKRERLEQLAAYRVRPAPDVPPASGRRVRCRGRPLRDCWGRSATSSGWAAHSVGRETQPHDERRWRRPWRRSASPSEGSPCGLWPPSAPCPD